MPDPHHALSHHENNPESIAKLIKLQTYHATLFSYYLERLRETPDGDGSLLDQVMVLYGSGMSNSNLHNIQKLPILLAGRGGGQLRGNQHLRYADETPLANLYVTLLDKMSIPVDHFGDSTGRLEGLSGV